VFDIPGCREGAEVYNRCRVTQVTPELCLEALRYPTVVEQAPSVEEGAD
jgi:hypothetical protein